jgi:hypothetical protein
MGYYSFDCISKWSASRFPPILTHNRFYFVASKCIVLTLCLLGSWLGMYKDHRVRLAVNWQCKFPFIRTGLSQAQKQLKPWTNTASLLCQCSRWSVRKVTENQQFVTSAIQYVTVGKSWNYIYLTSAEYEDEFQLLHHYVVFRSFQSVSDLNSSWMSYLA